MLLALVLSPGAGRAQTSTVQYINGKPAFMSNELLISFGPTEVINEAIDNQELNDGPLSQFVKGEALALIQQSTGVNLKNAPTRKIFLGMTSGDSLSIARTSDTVRVFPFWATFSVSVNGSTLSELQELGDKLSAVYPAILDVSLNLIFQQDAGPNDPLFQPKQYSLYPNPAYPNSGINLADNPSVGVYRGAWYYETGKPRVKVGIVDAGIRSSHYDLGGSTIPVVVGGWNFGNNVPLSTYPNGDSHGTAVAGIVGARRNNNLGIAGIAGGDNTSTGAGVLLFDMTVLQRFSNNAPAIIPTDALVRALVEGAVGSVRATYGFQLWVMNISLGGETFNPNRVPAVLRQAVRTCYQNSVVLAASRGNRGASGNPPAYPACFPDAWIMCVSASGRDGQIKRLGNGNPFTPLSDTYTSSYGYGADVMAPGTTALVHITGNASDTDYVSFNGTSAAAPHVAGVASLLLSYHNPSSPVAGLEAEDVEQIIQRTASDRHQDINNVTLPPGYDSYSGWGLLDAYKALGFIYRDRYQIEHAYGSFSPPTRGTMPPGYTLVGQQILNLDRPFNGTYLQPYLVNVYRMTATFPYQLSSNQAGTIATIVNAWPVTRRTNLLQAPQSGIIQTDQNWAEITAYTQPGGSGSAGGTVTMSGYVYHITREAYGTQQMNVWIPFNPKNVPTTFGATFRTRLEFMSNGNASLDVQVYPNPSADVVELQYETVEPGDVTIKLLDTQGVVRKQVEKTSVAVGAQQDQLTISDLPPGVYELQVTTTTDVMHETILHP